LAAFLKGYDAAFNAKDLGRLAGYYHPDVTIFEGGSTNDGWADYRDHHLGPELKEFEGLEFSHVKVVPHLLGDGRSAYVTAEYRLKAKVGDRAIDAEGLETLVMVKGSDGAWKIRHSHTSSRRRPAATP
jgi:ketosteroid isomerase-like protein